MSLLMNVLYPLIIITMIAFPKSGIAIGSIPLNTITIVIMLFTPILLLIFSFKKIKKANKNDIYLLTIIPFIFLYLIITLSNGVENYGEYLGTLFSFIVAPIFFFLLFKLTPENTIKKNYALLVLSIRFIAVYGIINLSIKQLTGDFFEIPGLTSTYGALVPLDEKMNDRGGIFKLFSTYNNGNLYGVSLCILFPLYSFLEKNKIFLLLTTVSIILTFSRTVWLLLIFFYIYTYIINSGLSPKKIIVGICSIVFSVLAIIHTLSLSTIDNNFVFDKNLGGRLSSIQAIKEFNFYSIEPFKNMLEIPYVSLIMYVGLAIIPFFLLYFITILLNYRLLISNKNNINKMCTLGILIYFISTFSDAALIYIPVFLIFCFVNNLALYHFETDTERYS